MKKLTTIAVALCASLSMAMADEGMWLPCLIGERIDDMRAKGFELTAEDIYSVNQAALKDAIVLFGRGCTGELVSAEGLLLTNHHCGYGQIQSHSSVEHDYLTNGFWAMNRGEELPNPGLTVSFLVRMEDVTDQIAAGTKAEEIRAKASEGGKYSTAIESLYYNNKYYLFVYQVYRDVRLVAAPPSSIGKFGGDTDNWMWPRHTGDFSVFRIYADKDNQPADYSKDNVPYTPKRHFTISTKGAEEGDFTFVYGFPGTTREYVTSDFVDYTLNHSNPAKIRLRTKRLDIISA
ncbi:MAG: S46 family peptidase, partial [Tidjanibacter sp.]|nr:S46 family peptidase [Tidjanibacter sp.]MBQ5931068.1 S46 family peptidase [Tidjanibacter sp.]